MKKQKELKERKISMRMTENEFFEMKTLADLMTNGSHAKLIRGLIRASYKKNKKLFSVDKMSDKK